MNDWTGSIFFIVLIAGALVGLKILARPTKRTTEEFERKAAKGGGALGASMNALQELLNPEAARSREVQMQMKDGRYGKKKKEGKSGGNK